MASSFTNGEGDNGTTQVWAGNVSKPDFVNKFFTQTADIPYASPEQTASAAGDDRALFYGINHSYELRNGDSFSDGFPYQKFTNVRSNGTSPVSSKFADTDFPLMRLGEAYLIAAEADARLNGSATSMQGTQYINMLRNRANATTSTAGYSLSDICDEWSREMGYEAVRRTTLIRFGRFGGQTDYSWAWKGGSYDGTAFDAGMNTYPIPAVEVGSTPEPYVVLTDSNTVMTFYYDGQKATRVGIDINNSNLGDSPSPYGTATSAVFDASFANYYPTSTAYWFQNCSALTSISGVENLKTDNVTNMAAMFMNCTGLTTLDLSSFNTAKVENMDNMFCQNSLTTIYVDGTKWNTGAVTSSTSMFYMCPNLVGGQGTVYDINRVDVSYAHIDGGLSNPGYFTPKNGYVEAPTFAWNADELTMTSGTEGATIYYTLTDAVTSTPTPTQYTAPITVTSDVLIEAYAEKDGMARSMTTTLNYPYTAWKALVDAIADAQNVLAQANTNDNVTAEQRDSLVNFINTAQGMYEARIDSAAAITQFTTDLTTLTETVRQAVEAIAEPYAVLSDNGIFVDPETGDEITAKTLTFYYDNLKEARNGMSVGPFNSSAERGWHEQRENITKVVFDNSFADCDTLTSTASWFAECGNLATIEDLNLLKTANVKGMHGMFYGCSSLTSIDLSNFNTANVTNMHEMFYGCSSLTSLDLNNFNTSNVTIMDALFAYCSGLSSVDVSSFNTTNVTNMMSMFNGCSSLTSLDVSNFNTAIVTEMSSMFADCHSLISLDVSNFNTSKVTDIRWMFKGSSGLKTIYVGSGWSTEAVTEGGDMFAYCTSLVGGKGTVYDADHTDYTYAHIDGGAANPGYLTPQGGYVEAPTFTWNGDNLTMTTGTEGATIYYTMADNSSATTPPTAVQYTSPVAVTNDVLITAYAEKEGMAQSPATVLDYPYTAWKALTDAIAAAQTVSAQAATNDNVSDTQRTELSTLITAAQDAYAERTEAKDAVEQRTATLTAYTQTIQNLVNAENEPYAVMTQTNSTGERFTLTFYYDKKKEERNGFGVGPFDGSQTYRWGGENPSYIKKIVFDESFDQCTSITSTAYWFRGCSGIFSTDSIVGLQYLHTDNVIDMKYMFEGMYSLAGVLDLSTFNTENVTDMAYMFSRCSTLDGIVVSNFNTAKVTDMKWMFNHMEKITTLDLTSFNTASVTYMDYMFQVCSALETIYIGSAWTTASLVAGGGSSSAGGGMFYNCHKLVGGLGTVYDGNHTNAEYAHIDGGPSNPGYLTLKLAMGDANGDGNINIADAVATVTNILGQPTAEVFYQYAADMNNDQVIDIFDVTMIVNAAFEATSPAPAMTRGSADNIMMEHISMTADADYIYLGVDQPERFTATQFDVTLPEGMELVDARLASATTDHQLSFVKRGENEYRVIGLSMSNATFRSLNGQLIKLEVSGSAVDSDVKMSNVLFVTPTATVMTSIDKCLNTAKAADDSFYDLKGQRVSKQQLGKGIYIMNHKKVIIK